VSQFNQIEEQGETIMDMKTIKHGLNHLFAFENLPADMHSQAGYLNGQFGLDKNYTEAEKWLNKAASQGHPDAERCLQEAFSKLAF